ncbi:MAG: hypothetical protein NC453_22235, partial [Muribaculum sp.]|nr:hypothetical protein [Muribaculum sp.]
YADRGSMRYPNRYIDDYAHNLGFETHWHQSEITHRWRVTLEATFEYVDGSRPKAIRLTRFEAMSYLNGFCDGKRGLG